MGHAYYEFQHVELANVGSGKKRVRNPPGGPTSNIFAAEEVTPPRSSRTNKMASSIPFGVDCVDSPPSSTTSSPPPTPVKPAGLPRPQARDQCPAPVLAPVTEEASDPVPRKASPNPVTGQGYEPAEVMKKPTPQPAAATPRRRIPPGGYSSPLW
ncbi:microtubule-associated protein Jupiter-like isoform X2 [Amphibalanus amphitrite]|uniref:microtubule-associated protein Jupiter-like isoform X2 n=1 Tax=Amphibalanus amphitrite TaxID=1232801 RepID=UPI001C8FCDD9|nr:microtubule-associated protein Jupiter-like isoform X2 [Amphibalanus amphitrite]XP_043223742.1 microtubule-associated protein Jupiter-like isoform X2 [Amphibalanus amphitrite]